MWKPIDLRNPEDGDDCSPKRRFEPVLHCTKSQKTSLIDTAVKVPQKTVEWSSNIKGLVISMVSGYHQNVFCRKQNVKDEILLLNAAEGRGVLSFFLSVTASVLSFLLSKVHLLERYIIQHHTSLILEAFSFPVSGP
jgi:hypothetical protein